MTANVQKLKYSTILSTQLARLFTPTRYEEAFLTHPSYFYCFDKTTRADQNYFKLPITQWRSHPAMQINIVSLSSFSLY